MGGHAWTSFVFRHRAGSHGDGLGVLVETRNGRPIKIEGNPLHPASLGATDVFAQAELLSFYDPDRSRIPLYRGSALDWPDALKVLTDARAGFASGGRGFGC